MWFKLYKTIFYFLSISSGDIALSKPFLTLRQALIVPFVLLTSLSISITGYFTWKYTQESILELGTQLSQKSAADAEEKINQMLEHSYRTNLIIKEALKNNFIKKNERTKLLNYIKNIVVEQKTQDTVGFGFPDGIYMGYVYSPKGWLQKEESNSGPGRFYTTYKITSNEHNQEVKTEIRRRKNYDARVRPWFKEALASPTAIWSSVFAMYGSQRVGITLSEAIYNKQDEFIGVVGTDLTFADLGEKLDSIRLTPNSVIFITDNKGHLIAYNSKEQQNSKKLLKVEESDHELIRKSYKALSEISASKAIKSTFKKLSIKNKTEQYFIHFSPYPYYRGLDWNIGVIIPEKDFLEKANKIKSYIIYIWIVSFLASLLIGMLITTLISKSIRNLQNNAMNIDNIHSQNLENYKIKEVYNLAKVFFELSEKVKQTLDSLKKSNEGLENEVSVRTRELREANQRLQHLSNTDNLTQIPNRRYFEGVLTQELDNLKQEKLNDLSLLMCDIDFFKQYNDTYGHQAGDKCLEKVAALIRHSIRKSDTVARYGGEEFIIILPGANQEVAKSIAQCIINKLADENIDHSKSAILSRVSISIGISTLTHKSALADQSSVIEHADKALYEAKAQGRNQYQVYSKDLT